MIVNFSSKTAQNIFDGTLTRYAKKVPIELHNKIRRLLDQINAAHKRDDLKSPPGNCLEPLKGKLSGKWSIRINNQWRIIFNWIDDKASNVDIVDYH